MKFAVMSSLTLNTPAQQDNLHNGILSLVTGKLTWGKTRVSKDTINGKPWHFVEVRFHNKKDMDDLFTHIKARMQLIPVLSGRVSKHNCSHDESNIPCIIEEEFVK